MSALEDIFGGPEGLRCHIEAQWFAVGFLMPTQAFMELVNKGWSNAEIAEHFDVSEAAVVCRKEGLEIQTPAQ